MRVEKLQRAVEQADVQQQALGSYSGPFSLGVGGDSGSPVVVLQVANAPRRVFPKTLRIDGESVPLVVRFGFRAPNAYAW